MFAAKESQTKSAPVAGASHQLTERNRRSPAGAARLPPGSFGNGPAPSARGDFDQRGRAGILASVLATLRSAGDPLDSAVRISMERRFEHDFSKVRVHRDSGAESSARELRARAYAVGNHLVFGPGQYAPATPAGQRLIAHELAHTLQQDPSRPTPGPFAAPGQEAAADRAAARVLAGRPPEGQAVTGPTIARQSDGGPSDAGVAEAQPSPPSPYYRPSPAEAADAVRAAMRRVMPVAGIGDYHAAYAILNGLSMRDLLAVLTSLRNSGDLTVLAANFGAARTFNEGRLQLAMVTVMTANGGIAQVPGNPGGLIDAVRALPEDQTNDLMVHLAEAVGPRTQEDIESVAREGQQLLDQEQAGQAGGPAGAMAGGMRGPGFWRPGLIPAGYYIGSTAHIGIAAYYSFAHLGEVVFTNFTSIASIVGQLAGTALAPGAAPGARPSAADLAGKPDIANMTLRHLYEIKPAGSEAQALTEARWYQATFAASGIPMALGPSADPGVNGFFYDIGWYFTFQSPEPGVVTYRRQQRPPGPVLVEAPERSRAPSDAPERRMRFSLPRLSPQQTVAVGTTLTAAAILLILIRFAPLLAL